MGKYLARGHGVRTERSEVRAPCAVFFRPRSRKCVRPSYGTFINGFAKKALAGPYGLYDNTFYCLQIPCFLMLVL